MDAELEALIDRAGREEVFYRARRYGWSGDGVPKHVWQGIAWEIINNEPLAAPPQRLDEAVLGFRLF